MTDHPVNLAEIEAIAEGCTYYAFLRRHDLIAMLADLRALAEVDRTINDVFPGSTEDGINAVLWACIARHRARKATE